MTQDKSLARLGQISQLILDVRLAKLQAVAKQRQHSLDLLEQLNVPPADDLPLVIAHQNGMRYQKWAEARRAEINATLARQTADMLAAREDASQAFGRNQALRGLQGRLR